MLASERSTFSSIALSLTLSPTSPTEISIKRRAVLPNFKTKSIYFSRRAQRPTFSRRLARASPCLPLFSSMFTTVRKLDTIGLNRQSRFFFFSFKIFQLLLCLFQISLLDLDIVFQLQMFHLSILLPPDLLPLFLMLVSDPLDFLEMFLFNFFRFTFRRLRSGSAGGSDVSRGRRDSWSWTSWFCIPTQATTRSRATLR